MVQSLPSIRFAAWFSIGGVLVGSHVAAWSAEPTTPDSPRAFQWNVMLSDWQVLGPIPKLNRNDTELNRVLVPDETSLHPGTAVTIAGKEYTWRPWPRGLVNFHRALDAKGGTAQYALSYAATEFTSDEAREATLSLSHDDGAVIWLNGEEVYRSDANASSRLDQAAVKVALKKGTNQLLAKVGQATSTWELAVRLRPAGLERPILLFYGEPISGGDLSRLPTLELELLDAGGNVMDTWRASGGRSEAGAVYYSVFAAPPDPEPAAVRVRCAGPGFARVEKTYPWSQARSGNAILSLRSVGPLRGRIVDQTSGKPVVGAELYAGEALLGKPTDDDGRFEIQSPDPLLDTVVVRAAGFEPRPTQVAWPPSDNWIIKIPPGGHVLRGRVLSSDGKSIAGAVIRAYMTGRNLNLTTDAEGRFEVIGLPRSSDALYPTVTHPEYVAKDGFSLPLDPDGMTDVEWRLETGAVVTGRVTAKEDGRPLSGIVVIAGSDRFASNRANPEALTDADGRYRLAGVKPGPALVHVMDGGFSPAVQQANATLDKAATADFVLEPGKPITGRITEPEGKPVVGATLAVDTWNNARMLDRRVTTNSNGEFRFENMPATPAEIHIFKRDYVSKRDLQAVGGERYDITLSPVVEHTIRVRLADRQASPGEVTIQKGYQWQGRTEVSWQDESYNNEATYDPVAGVVRIRLDETSTAKISWRLRVPGYRDAVIDNLESGGDPQSIDVLLAKMESVTGKVVRAETGEPLEGVMVALVSKQDRLRLDHYVEFDSSFRAVEQFTGVHVNSAGDGSFKLPTVGDGAEEVDLLLLRKGDGFHYIRDARSLLGTGPVELPLPQGGQVQGRITVAGEPVPGSEVHLAWIGPGQDPYSYDLPFGFGGQTTTDADGRFRYTGLGPGRYRFSRIRSFRNPLGGGSMSAHLSGDELVVLPGQTVTHDANQPAGDTLTGQTVGLDGQPLSNCLIYVSHAKEPNGRIEAVMTDATGRFTVPHLQPGSYSLRAEQYQLASGAGLGQEGAFGNATVKVAGNSSVTIKMSPRAQGQVGGGQSTLVGTVPPDFTGTLLDGAGSFALSDHFGKVVAIDFWATWCGPCMAVMPQMKELHEKYKDSGDVKFITVSLDQDVEELRRVMKEQGLAFPVIYENVGASQAIASAFGATAIPSSFVIGRDGRFASERIHGAQLTAAVEAAVKLPPDPAFASGAKPARLTIKLALDDDNSGLPGATITLKALGADGTPAREETIRPLGPAKQFTWLYPALTGGGEIDVKVEADGVAPQEKVVLEPEAGAEVTFKFQSPRTITGRVTADDGATPAPGMKVSAYRTDGFLRDAVTDHDGTFRIAVLPGTYSLAMSGTDDFAPIGTIREQVDIEVDSDPGPLDLSVCRAVSVTGTVTDEDGATVADAEVRLAISSNSVKTDDEGKFELRGVPSQGSVQLYALKRPKFAIATLEDFDGREPQTLVLGEQGSGRRGSPATGTKAPPLKLLALAGGEPIDWKPAADKDTLVVFCALWHPKSRDLLAEARAWADEHQANLAAISIDWSLEQARRGAEALKGIKANEIQFAGPGGLAIAKDWNLSSPVQTYLVTSNGRIQVSPPPGELPSK
jgi:thiol-disulfide isomerase/thioredoxin/protocatechuate 3,4-dioxygenase beta subunit